MQLLITRLMVVESLLMDTLQKHVRPMGCLNVELGNITFCIQCTVIICDKLSDGAFLEQQLLVTDVLTTQLFSEQPSSRQSHYTSHLLLVQVCHVMAFHS